MKLPVPPESVRTSMRYFTLYRLMVASLFLIAILGYGKAFNLGVDKPFLFAWTTLAWWLAALFFYLGGNKFRVAFGVVLTIQIFVDIVALTFMLHASGGIKSGLAVLLLVTLAAAGLVGQGRLSLLFASLATVALLFEHALRVLWLEGDGADFVQVGITSVGFFAVAISARLLARRILTNEALARQRGADLEKQLSINRRIIRDMQDGVLVVDSAGLVRHHNPPVSMLVGRSVENGTLLTELADELALVMEEQILQGVETVRVIRSDHSGKTLRVRRISLEGGDTLIYLEDLERVQQQAQQIKLAALGRLTANMAHEIRNPLSAISHAAELLQEERRGDMHVRLARIVIDNAQRLERLVQEVLELGRRNRADPESIRLSSFLDMFLEEFVVREQVSQEICVLKVDDDPVLRFDRVHLNQVLCNLLGNALRYCQRQPGSIRVSACSDASGRWTELHIVDDGPGVPVASRGEIFEPFFTTHGQGTGLGLYIARELCDANGSVLELLQNVPGAYFRIVGRSDKW